MATIPLMVWAYASALLAIPLRVVPVALLSSASYLARKVYQLRGFARAAAFAVSITAILNP
ncbi:MAG: hypothetical protein LBB38_02550 [Puniceicoccales bacterium]|jgi:hypothetical protein|nr:hypothetical protein [Puniceicoccales bacterium]